VFRLFFAPRKLATQTVAVKQEQKR